MKFTSEFNSLPVVNYSDEPKDIPNIIKDKIGFAPLFPDYTFKHPSGNTGAVIDNIVPTLLSFTAYNVIEDSVQKLNPHSGSSAIHDAVLNLPEAIRKPLQDQGSDFASAAYYSAIYGGVAMEGIRIAANLIAPQSKATKFIENNYLNLRNGVGFGMLVGHEIGQALEKKTGSMMSNLDVKDIGAYALGIAAFCYAPKIIHKLYKGSKQLFEETKKTLCPTPQDRIRQQMRYSAKSSA